MSKLNLHASDKGYQTVISRTNMKKSKNDESLLRKQLADPMEDQELVMKRSQFNSVVALTKLSYEEFITRAKENL
jgi:hypothetical protein